MKLPLKPNTRIHTPRVTLGIFVFAPSDGCPAIANFLSLDASLAILTRVLHFKVSRQRHHTTVRPVLLIGQTGLMPLPPVFGVWFVDQPRNPVVL
jgi:hypothetical protein